ncbi:hypothetical protein RHMOL_Rhmol04G0378100 [Rhododendron molle]|uniref:Uncharacterized protein n=2 Tax=Rhododendron molle TaxID=49168 RepID=A0ACC0P9R3_RHOML|nr:hypothetical protein RHMOL_Rhmol04G0378100 [Rhododendron molle]KAI8561902.1 hypothetical protein RHMOL_Rhmol04G0378100 [Rhododendron molle]
MTNEEDASFVLLQILSKPHLQPLKILGDRVLLLLSHCSSAAPWLAHRIDIGSAHALWIDWCGFVLFLQCTKPNKRIG